MKKGITLYLIFISTQAFGQAPLEDAYKDGLSVAQRGMQKSVDSIKNLTPTDVFKDQSGGSYYTANPPQAGHYQGVTQGNKDILESAGREGIDNNEATKAVWGTFGNPKIKINPNEPWLSKSNDIVKNSADITMGISSKPGEVVKAGTPAGINCKESKICHIELIKKLCNEPTRTLKKICEKIPKIAITDEFYQETQQYSGSIPPVQTTITYRGRSRLGPDIRTGTFTLPVSGTITSFSASFGSRHINFGSWRCCGDGHGDWPGPGGAIRGYLDGHYLSTSCVGWDGCEGWVYSMNYNNNNLNIPVVAGAPITFRIDGQARSHWSSSHYNLTIIANLKRKVAKVESWQEKNCSEI